METIDSLRIYVACRGDLPLVLVPDADNIPTVVEPAPTLIRAEYILQDEATDDRLFQAAQRLEQTGMLLLMQPGVDGPNSRTAFVYPQPEDCIISAWHDAGCECEARCRFVFASPRPASCLALGLPQQRGAEVHHVVGQRTPQGHALGLR